MSAALLKMLNAYISANPAEQASRNRIAALVRDQAPQCFYRHNFTPGHVTGSGLLVSDDHEKVLMNHHKSLGKWLCFGGHADGSADIFDVARREVIEESGIAAPVPVSHDIFDLDVHDIPASSARAEPAHGHYDIAFLFQAPRSEKICASDESHEVRWCDYGQARALVGDSDPRMVRMLDKWRRLK